MAAEKPRTALVEGYGGKYLIASDGVVRSRWRAERALLPRVDRDGYLRTQLSHNGVRSYPQIHRLVAMAFVPNPDDKPHVNHLNGIKSDNRVENLEWVTPAENSRHWRAAAATRQAASARDIFAAAALGTLLTNHTPEAAIQRAFEIADQCMVARAKKEDA